MNNLSISVPEQLVMTVPNILKISKETSGLFLVMFSIRFNLISAGWIHLFCMKMIECFSSNRKCYRKSWWKWTKLIGSYENRLNDCCRVGKVLLLTDVTRVTSDMQNKTFSYSSLNRNLCHFWSFYDILACHQNDSI